jgi:hypothetical protein
MIALSRDDIIVADRVLEIKWRFSAGFRDYAGAFVKYRINWLRCLGGMCW